MYLRQLNSGRPAHVILWEIPLSYRGRISSDRKWARYIRFCTAFPYLRGELYDYLDILRCLFRGWLGRGVAGSVLYLQSTLSPP